MHPDWVEHIPSYMIFELMVRVSFIADIQCFDSYYLLPDKAVIKTTNGFYSIPMNILKKQNSSPESITGQEIHAILASFVPLN